MAQRVRMKSGRSAGEKRVVRLPQGAHFRFRDIPENAKTTEAAKAADVRGLDGVVMRTTPLRAIVRVDGFPVPEKSGWLGWGVQWERIEPCNCCSALHRARRKDRK